MKTLQKPYVSRILLRALTVVAIALMLASPPRLYGDDRKFTVTVSPSTVISGNPVVLKATFSVSGGPVPGPIFVSFAAYASDGHLLYTGGGYFTGSDLTITAQWETGNYPFTKPITATFYGAMDASHYGQASFEILPSGHAANPGNLGPANSPTACATKCGQPINLTDGNVWIAQRDYTAPGLGGGLQLSRVWNSRWMVASPPTLAGMFGNSWRSTYEELLAGPDSNNNLIYWRSDGSGWTFTYNSSLNSYTITSPPDVRAQLVPNPTGGFTLENRGRSPRSLVSQSRRGPRVRDPSLHLGVVKYASPPPQWGRAKLRGWLQVVL